MGTSQLWTLASVLVTVLLCQPTKGATLLSPPLSVFLGDTVRLVCKDHGQTGLNFYKDGSLLKQNRRYFFKQTRDAVVLTINSVSASDEGWYSCGIDEENMNYEHYLTVTETVRRVSLTLDPNWSVVFVGERLTLRCEVEGSGDSWTYQWRRNNTFLTEKTKEHILLSVTQSDRGVYSCRGQTDTDLTTQWSSTTSVSVLNKPEARVSGYTELQTGGSVTLRCSVSFSSSGWKYEWNRNKQLISTDGRSELTVSEGGQYQCRGARGDPLYFTEPSPSLRLTQTVSNKVSLILDPNWSVVFVGERLTLRCEVKGGQSWTYQWKKNEKFLTERTKEYTLLSVTESDRGDYSCRGQKEKGPYLRTLWSSITYVNIFNKPEARVRGYTELPTVGSVTLRCSVSPSFSGWKYEWSRNKQLISTDGRSELTVSEGGQYQCRGARGDPLYFTELSPSLRLTQTASNKVSLMLDPNWSEVFVGEKLTLRCEVEGSGESWTYRWRRNNDFLTKTTSDYTLLSVTESDRGSYSCRGVLEHTVTEWSRPLTVHVSQSVPRPLLSVPVSWLSPGASVSLSCAVTAPSAGWSYHWYRAVPQSGSYRYELLPEASAGSTQDSFSVQGPTNTAAFVCRAERGTPRFSSEHSEPCFVWSADAESSVSLSVSPDRAQHFTDDVITLSCGFNSTDTDWRVRRLHQNKLSTQNCVQYLGTVRTKCEFYQHNVKSAVYWCESGSGEMSNALNISVHRDIILVSPVRPVTEGQPVSLGCKLKTETSSALLYSFYKNGKLVQTGTKADLSFSAVSRPDQGFYKCEAQQENKWPYSATNTWTSAESWMSVRTPRPKDGLSFPVMWLVGSVCAVVLPVLLLLLWPYKIKDLCSLRTTQTNQSSAEDQVTSDDPSPPNDVTYSVLELKNIKGRTNSQQEETLYSEPHSSADGNVTYARVNRKAKAKSTPATEDTIYSQIEYH